MGKEERANLIKVSLPAWEMVVFQPERAFWVARLYNCTTSIHTKIPHTELNVIKL